MRSIMSEPEARGPEEQEPVDKRPRRGVVLGIGPRFSRRFLGE